MADDTISRKVALDTIADYERDSTAPIDYKAIIKALPTTESQWIPVSERLPEDEELILFSTITGRVHQGRFHKDNSLNQWYSSLDKLRVFNRVVNAWMPLPQPYKGETDG